jgi:hypothetical protein
MQKKMTHRNSSKIGATTKIFSLLFISASLMLLQACGGGPPMGSPNDILAPAGGLVSIQVTPGTPYLTLGASRQLVATGVYANGATQDVTPQVTWNASSISVGSPVSCVSVSASGVATGMLLGSSNITATVGNVAGGLNLTVNTNGYTTSTLAAMVVQVKNQTLDVAYVPKSLNQVQGRYRVEEVNLDADQTNGGILPVPAALIASVAMPAGFVPNAAIADPTGMRIAVVSYSSADIQIIDASNLPSLDPLSNTVTATYTAPVTKSITLSGITCTICAGAVNPLDGQLIVSTAQGYYTMDLGTGVFSQLTFTPPAFPTLNFTLNPSLGSSGGNAVSTDPYLINPTFGQDPANPSEVQILDLKNNTSTTNTNFGLSGPLASAFDFAGHSGIVVDSLANNQAFADFTDPQNPVVSPVANVASCTTSPTPAVLSMAALGIPACPYPVGAQSTCSTIPTLFLAQPSGSCVGFEQWEFGNLVQNPAQIGYVYGTMPALPDGSPFLNGSDPNTITTFSDVVDKHTYGMLQSTEQDWVVKINPSSTNGPFTLLGTPPPLPTGEPLVAADLTAGQAGDPVVYFPTPDTLAITSRANLPFGNVAVASPGLSLSFTLTNIDANITSTAFLTITQISIQGTNAGDFLENDNCAGELNPQTSCTINVIFTPKATGARSAVLTITDDGGESPQMVTLSGTGT